MAKDGDTWIKQQELLSAYYRGQRDVLSLLRQHLGIHPMVATFCATVEDNIKTLEAEDRRE